MTTITHSPSCPVSAPDFKPVIGGPSQCTCDFAARLAAYLDFPVPKRRFGFASMPREKQREIASRGGRAQGRHNNGGNFANNRERARAAGRKGGLKKRV